MKKLSARGQKWLKGIHVTFACMWVGAAICLSVKQFFIKPMNGAIHKRFCNAALYQKSRLPRDKADFSLKLFQGFHFICHDLNRIINPHPVEIQNVFEFCGIFYENPSLLSDDTLIQGQGEKRLILVKTVVRQEMNLILFKIFVPINARFVEGQGGGQEGLTSKADFINFSAGDRFEQGGKEVVVIYSGHAVDGRHVFEHDFQRDPAHGPS